jgi:outer membrane protein assembly factor BamD (BamD/ComL family)
LAVYAVDILIESTNNFEKDLSSLTEGEKERAIQEVDRYAELFPTQKEKVYLQLHQLPYPSVLDGYDSSLYILKISQTLSVILTVDEDPIFGQIIFTLFRAIQHSNLDKAYKSVAEALHQDFLRQDQEIAKVS